MDFHRYIDCNEVSVSTLLEEYSLTLNSQCIVHFCNLVVVQVLLHFPPFNNHHRRPQLHHGVFSNIPRHLPKGRPGEIGDTCRAREYGFTLTLLQRNIRWTRQVSRLSGSPNRHWRKQEGHHDNLRWESSWSRDGKNYSGLSARRHFERLGFSRVHTLRLYILGS